MPRELPQRRVHFVSLGCAKNRVDTEVMLGAVRRAGHDILATPQQADVIVVNTCAFIEAAREESIDTILELAEYKRSAECRKLVVTGCLGQGYAKEVSQSIPEIDHILGTGDFARIAEVVRSSADEPRRRTPTDGKPSPRVQVTDPPRYLYDHNTPRVLSGATHAVYVKVAEGCDRPCAFCAIPRLRGPLRSRPMASIIREIERLVAGGAVEVSLVAQDITRYAEDLSKSTAGLVALLDQTARIAGLKWLRLLYAYPTGFSDALIEAIARQSAILNYIDVPVQHIDDGVLCLMRRGHDAQLVRELIGRLRAALECLVLRTTLLVGHPGESEEAFERLCDFVVEVEFDHVGVFAYSPEPKTASGGRSDAVATEVALGRKARILELQREISRRKNRSMVGRRIRVLVDGPSAESEFLLEGRWWGQAPEVDGVVYLTDGAAQVGELVWARVTDSGDYDLVASICD